jgi:hypothetical protein
VQDPYAKGKRPLEGGGRGHILKAPKFEAGTDRNKGKSKPSSAFFPRFREYYYPIVNPGEAQYLYELHESKRLPKKNIQLTPEKLEILLGAVPTEEDITRSSQILEVICSTETNAQLYVYEMHQEKRSNGTHQSYFVDYNWFTVKSEQVNSTYLYSLLPYKDTQKYGDYWAILRKRPGAAALTIPEYMPNKQHRYKEVLDDFEHAGLTLSPSRYWTEVPLSQFKVEFTYPYFPYFMGNKVNVKKINKDLNLNQIPYKSEQVLEEKSRIDKNGNMRSAGRDVNPRETMSKLLSLQILPNDHKATLDAYLHKLEGHMEDLNDIVARIPFAITHKVAAAQLSRLSGLAKIKAAKAVPLLQAGELYATGETVSPYPVKEHHDLVTTKTIYTPLETILTARAAKSDAKDPATKALFDTYKKSADTLTFRGHRNAPVARVEWEDYYVFMKALVIEHPKLLLAENKGFNKTLSKLYRASSDFIGNASLTVEQQSTLKTRSLCLPLVSYNPWQKGAQEAVHPQILASH